MNYRRDHRHALLRAMQRLPGVCPGVLIRGVLWAIEKNRSDLLEFVDWASDSRGIWRGTTATGARFRVVADPSAKFVVTFMAGVNYMHRLVFSNADATPKNVAIDLSAESVPHVMAWYGAYCAGDRYTVTLDGRNIPMDQNGEALPGTKEASQ